MAPPSLLIRWMLTTVGAGLFWGTVALAFGSECDLQQTEDTARHVITWRLIGVCSSEQREAHAVSADSIVEALQKGNGVDLQGVVIHGDLKLDTLVPQPLNGGVLTTQEVRQIFLDQEISEARVIRGPLLIRDSVVRGILATNLVTQGYLIIQGPVDMSGTVFDQSVDFSRTVFAGAVDFSSTRIMHEGFFIQAKFTDPVDFHNTAFGTHSRFHKAVFFKAVSFSRARFAGLAEFLELTFDQDADFSRTRFVMGTGFSGSRFHGIINFSEAVFEQETYFRFAEFDQNAIFRQTGFQNTADFTGAKFQGKADFTHARFTRPPEFSGTPSPFRSSPSSVAQDLQFHVWVWGILCSFIVVFVWMWKKTHGAKFL